MAIAFVQKSTGIFTTSNSLPVASTAGTLLTAHIRAGSTPSPPASWLLAVGNTTNRAWIYYYPNNPGGLNGFNFGSSATLLALTEWSGVDTSSPLDTTGINSASSSPVTATTSGNVTEANSLAVGTVIDDESKAGTTTMGAGAGWTNELDNGSTSSGNHLLISSRLNPTSGATLSEQGSSSNMNVTLLGVAIAVFKPASAVVIPNKGRIYGQAVKRSFYF